MDILSTNVANTISMNVKTNSDSKIDCDIFHTVLLVIVFIIAIICYHAKHRSKQKSIDGLTI